MRRTVTLVILIASILGAVLFFTVSREKKSHRSNTLDQQQATAALLKAARGEGVRGMQPNGIEMTAFRGWPQFYDETRFWYVIRQGKLSGDSPTFYDAAEVIKYMMHEGGITEFQPFDGFVVKHANPTLSCVEADKSNPGAVNPKTSYSTTKTIETDLNEDQAITVLRDAEWGAGIIGSGIDGRESIAVRTWPEFYDTQRLWQEGSRTKGLFSLSDEAPYYYNDPAKLVRSLKRRYGISTFRPVEAFVASGLRGPCGVEEVPADIMNREQAISTLLNAEASAGVAGTGNLRGTVMIALKLSAEIPEYSEKGHFEIRTLGEHGIWTKQRYYKEAAQAIDMLVREGHILAFRVYHD